jgi:SAM-dependent methyltransferase
MLALLYHAHHNRHLEDLPFWLELGRRYNGPILELGCGSGRVLLPLARQGYDVVGLERDPEMLTVLRQNLTPDLARRVQLVQGDMASFNLGQRYALILLPCNTLSTLDAAQRLGMLECVRRHLRPDGLFAASLPNPALLRRLPRSAEPELEESFPHPLDGEPVQVSNGWLRTSRHLTIQWHYDHLLPDGQVERISTQARHELASADDYAAELAAAGLRPVERYGDFDGSIFHPQSPYLILTASISQDSARFAPGS